MTEDTFDSLKKERDELKNFITMKRKEEKGRQKLGEIFTTVFLGFAFWCVVDYLRHMAITGLEYSIVSGGLDQMTGAVYLGMVAISVIFLWGFGLFWLIGQINSIYGEYYPEIYRRLKKSFVAFAKNEKDL